MKFKYTIELSTPQNGVVETVKEHEDATWTKAKTRVMANIESRLETLLGYIVQEDEDGDPTGVVCNLAFTNAFCCCSYAFGDDTRIEKNARSIDHPDEIIPAVILNIARSGMEKIARQ